MSFASATTRADILELNGTNNSDTFDVNSPADQIQILDQASSFVTVVLNTSGINTLELRGLDGDDTFSLFGALPYLGGTLVDGGDPTGSDIVNLSGATGPVTVNLADSAAIPPTDTTITGYGGTVTLTGVEVANLDAGGHVLTTVGMAGNDSLAVTPTGTNAATVQAYSGGTAQNGQGGTLASQTPVGPTLNFTNVSSAAGGFTINGNGGSDQLLRRGDPKAPTPSTSTTRSRGPTPSRSAVSWMWSYSPYCPR